MTTDVDTIAATVLSLERAAGERWNEGDIEVPLELYADDDFLRPDHRRAA